MVTIEQNKDNDKKFDTGIKETIIMHDGMFIDEQPITESSEDEDLEYFTE